MAEKNRSFESEHEETTEQRILRELAGRVHSLTDNFLEEAFEVSGIFPLDISPTVNYEVSLKSKNIPHRTINVTIGKPWADDKRRINIKEVNDLGHEVFSMGRFIDVKGRMFVYGDAFTEVNLSADELVSAIDRLEFVAQSQYSVEVNMKHEHQQSSDVAVA